MKKTLIQLQTGDVVVFPDHLTFDGDVVGTVEQPLRSTEDGDTQFIAAVDSRGCTLLVYVPDDRVHDLVEVQP